MILHPFFQYTFSWYTFISYLLVYGCIVNFPLHNVLMHHHLCALTDVGQWWGARVHSYSDRDRLTTTEQTDHHVFCQPYDILIRLFKIDIQKTDHNSWGLVSVDLLFLYFLGEKSTPVVWKMHTMDCLWCLFSVLKDADLPQTLMYIVILEILYTRLEVKVLMLLKYAWGGWCLLGNAAGLLARVQSVNKHKTAFSFLDTILSKPAYIRSWWRREGWIQNSACILNLKAEEIKCNANSISWFLIGDMVAFENGEDFLGASSGSLGFLWLEKSKTIRKRDLNWPCHTAVTCLTEKW